jgi:protein-S-isoprenylcysteine O-methyltransferase Ste14
MAAGCAALALLSRPFWHDLTVEVTWARVFGLVVLVTSTAFAVWARVSLGNMWSFDAEVKVDHQLRTSGPYAVTRHPIYTGLLGMLIGSTLLSGVGKWIVLVLAGLVLFEVKSRSEEKILVESFPSHYPGYRERVPRLLPGLSLLPWHARP